MRKLFGPSVVQAEIKTNYGTVGDVRKVVEKSRVLPNH